MRMPSRRITWKDSFSGSIISATIRFQRPSSALSQGPGTYFRPSTNSAEPIYTEPKCWRDSRGLRTGSHEKMHCRLSPCCLCPRRPHARHSSAARRAGIREVGACRVLVLARHARSLRTRSWHVRREDRAVSRFGRLLIVQSPG